MQDTTIITAIKDNIVNSMKSIFSFSLARTNNASEAEDLSQQIITELLTSANTLKDVNAFYGWMWSVAKNTYGKYSRKRAKERNMQSGYDIYDMDDDNSGIGGMNIFMPQIRNSVEDDIILKEDTNLLKRELSLLAYKYREAVVKYYLEDKSCNQIAEELSVTVETVKQLLFKARKILKEGINMNREFGEKSYKPGEFTFSSHKFNGSDTEYVKIFDRRKLPGNILLSAYYEPLTIEEMSVELGVAAPYLEDEIKILLDAGLIKLMQNGRYQANIFIYTTACEEDIELKTKKLYEDTANKVQQFIDENYDKIKEIAFNGENISQNKLRWFATTFFMCEFHLNRLRRMDKTLSNNLPPLAYGGQGYLFGYNKSEPDFKHNQLVKHSNINMNSIKYKGKAFYIFYKFLEKCQPPSPFYGNEALDLLEFILGAANNAFEDFAPDEIAVNVSKGIIEKSGDSYKTLIHGITKDAQDKLLELPQNLFEEIRVMLDELTCVTAQIMENHAPSAIKEQAKNLAEIIKSINPDIIFYTTEILYENGWLIVPQMLECLAMYTVV
ncbi:MAG: sigma-70 family RNA polymerase sigma factor [Oscillospiraceae bacterium]|nr:sigma-70 family RNA polymerase sigma factor [Oscillospiraceae bacterium]